MNMKLTQNRTFRRMLINILSIFVILAMAFPATTVAAAPSSPFVGKWEAVDVDGSDIRLAIGGPPSGPFQITWTESKDDGGLGFCEGGPGIVRGTGSLNGDDPFALEADLWVECFTIEKSMEFHLTFRYLPNTDTLATTYPGGMMVVFTHPRSPQASPAQVRLMTNYQEDWASGFYEEGHTVWLAVTESDGISVKATAEMVTGPQPGWDGGEIGFASQPWEWQPEQPDIVPGDWVYAWVDNGASAQMQVGEISAWVDVENDQVRGTVSASWYSQEVYIYCFLWGGTDARNDMIMADGSEEFICSWSGGAYDIQPGDVAEVQYYGPDGHAVDYYLFIPNPRIVASEAGDWFWTTEFNTGTLDLFLYESADEGATLLWSGHTDVTDTWGITFVGYDMHGQDMMPGNYLVVSDGVNSKGLVLQTITVDVFDTENEIMSGTAPLGRDVVAAAGPQEWQERITVTADSETGAWLADFKTIGFDITEDMRGWSSAAIYDEDGDANEGSTPPPPPNPRFVVFPEWEWFDGNDWPDGATVDITVGGKPECATSKESWGYFFNGNFGEGCDVVVGDEVTFTDGTTTRTHVVRNLAITDVDKDSNTVAGTADDGAIVYAWVHGFGETEMQLTAENGFWLADFNLRDFDLVEGTCGRSEIRDEFGNSTAVDWCVPNPHFSVFPEWEYIEGWDWPDGALVTASVNEKPQCDAQGTSGHPSWDPNALFVPLWLPDGCDVVVGDIVTLTDNVTSRTHTVQDLAVTTVDKDANTITGTADPGAMVHVWPHGYNELLPTADADGNWIADFNETGPDLVEGMGGRTEVRDEFGNATAVEWRILNPYIEAAPYSDWIHAREWPIGTEMTLEIDDPSNGPGVDYLDTAIMQQAPWNLNDPNDIVADFRWPDEFAPGPGYVLTMSGDGQTKTLTISNLNVTGFDLDADTISGIGTPNAQVQVCANVPNRCITRWVTAAEGSGGWAANYGVPGTGNDDPDTFDVQPGSNGWAADYEADSDRTWFDWWVPNPRFVVFPEWEWFDGNDWPDGATVYITVEGKSECTTSKVSSGYFFNGNFGEGCDVVVGDVVTFTDNVTTRTHTVRNLAVTAVDDVADTVAGTADPYETVYVWQHEPGEQIPVQANEYGEWLADLSEDYDIHPGSSGRSEIRDELGNATAVDWYVSNPRIFASITEDWFFVTEFAPNVELNFALYASQGGASIWEGTTPPTDGSGHVWVNADGRWDLEPGNYLTVSDGMSTKVLVIEGFTFDVFNLVQGSLQGSVPGLEGRLVWVGIGFADHTWSTEVFTDANGNWTANFGGPVPSDYQWVAAQIYDMDGDATELRPNQIIGRTITVGNFYVEWSSTNPEEVVDLRWNGSGNLTNPWEHSNCQGDLEFFGNSWVTETDIFWSSLVGWGTTGVWSQTDSTIDIQSMSSGCPGSAGFPINTQYQFFESKPDLIMIQRTLEFGDTPYAHDVRPFIPRLYPSDGFTEVLHPNVSGDELVTDITCDFGCVAESWNGSWFAIHDPVTGQGMIVQRVSSSNSVALWLDDDDGSFTNATSFLLLQPDGGFTGTVTETEYLCFYDSSSWTPSLDLPDECQL